MDCRLHENVPGDIRDVVRQSIGAQSSHRWTRDKIWDLVANRVSLEDPGPSPMDIGALQGDYDECEVEEYLGAVWKGSRGFGACGEQGHFSSECVTKSGKKGHGQRPGGKMPRVGEAQRRRAAGACHREDRLSPRPSPKVGVEWERRRRRKGRVRGGCRVRAQVDGARCCRRSSGLVVGRAGLSETGRREGRGRESEASGETARGRSKVWAVVVPGLAPRPQ